VPTSDRAREFVASASRSPTFVVTSIGARAGQRIAYAVALPDAPTFAVYAERAIPANRRAPVESNPAFADLNYATYLGPTTRLSALATTDLPLADLPLTGGTARDVIPFGNTALTLVASPRGPLGGTLGGALPWIVLVGGAVLTIATAAAARELDKYLPGPGVDALGLHGRTCGKARGEHREGPAPLGGGSHAPGRDTR
jgi:hypothetical protein